MIWVKISVVKVVEWSWLKEIKLTISSTWGKNMGRKETNNHVLFCSNTISVNINVVN